MPSVVRTRWKLVVAIAAWVASLAILGRRPDYNPFFVLETFRNLRTISSLRWLDDRIRAFHAKNARYPADSQELREFVAKLKDPIDLRGLEFDYRVEDGTYTVSWSRPSAPLSRDSVLIHDGYVYLSLADVGRSGVLLHCEPVAARATGTPR
jgi:hypothetical protein